jgi:hypothetical protein
MQQCTKLLRKAEVSEIERKDSWKCSLMIRNHWRLLRTKKHGSSHSEESNVELSLLLIGGSGGWFLDDIRHGTAQLSCETIQVDVWASPNIGICVFRFYQIDILFKLRLYKAYIVKNNENFI